MCSSILFIIALSILLPVSHCSGIVWLQVTSSQRVGTRIEIIDKTNISRYGISVDLQLFPNVPREYAIPMPSSPSHSPFPIFDYTIQMMNPVTGRRIGDKMGHRLPLLASSPWINGTFSQQSITISTSVRLKCITKFYGSKCQFQCPSGEKCGNEEKPNKICQNDSKLLFNGLENVCNCKPGFYGEFCEKMEQSETPYKLVNPQDSIIVCFIFFLLFVSVALLVAILTIVRYSHPERRISEPELIGSIRENSYVAFRYHHHSIV